MGIGNVSAVGNVPDRADASGPVVSSRESPRVSLRARPCDGGRGGSSRQVTSRGPDPAGLDAAVRPARASKTVRAPSSLLCSDHSIGKPKHQSRVPRPSRGDKTAASHPARHHGVRVRRHTRGWLLLSFFLSGSVKPHAPRSGVRSGWTQVHSFPASYYVLRAPLPFSFHSFTHSRG
jgi:hypothetical protein